MHQCMHMDIQARMEMLEHHHYSTLWINWTLIALGIWMISAPLTVGSWCTLCLLAVMPLSAKQIA